MSDATHATRRGNEDLVKILAEDREIIERIIKGNEDVVKILAEAGADFEARSDATHATRRGNEDDNGPDDDIDYSGFMGM